MKEAIQSCPEMGVGCLGRKDASKDRTYQGAFVSDNVFIALRFQSTCDSNPVSSRKPPEISASPTNLFPVATGCAMDSLIFFMSVGSLKLAD